MNGLWDDDGLTTDNNLTIYNESTETINSIKTAIGSGYTEPSWSSATEQLAPSTVSGSGSVSYTINVTLGATNLDFVWVKITTSTGKYLVGGFTYQTNDSWGLYVTAD